MHYHQIHHPTYKNNKIMLKKVILDSSCIRPFFSPKFSFIPKENKMKKREIKEKYIVGNIYSLRGAECDDFKMPSKEYELVAIVSNVNEINLDSLVMKQISGNVGTIFSLTKNDCRLLNIEFQQGLQLFPKNLDWKEVKIEKNEEIKQEEKTKTEDIKIFDENNMSTYPVNYEDRTVRHIMIEISGCNYIPCGDFIILPDGNRMRKNEFLNKLSIRLRRPLYGNGDNSAMFNINEAINYRIMTSEIGNCTTNNVVDSNGNIYVELSLIKKQIVSRQKTIDGHIGVHPRVFDNQPFNEIFEVSYLKYEHTNYDNIGKTKEINKSYDSLTNLLKDVRYEILPNLTNVDNSIEDVFDEVRNINKSMQFEIDKIKYKYGL